MQDKNPLLGLLPVPLLLMAGTAFWWTGCDTLRDATPETAANTFAPARMAPPTFVANVVVRPVQGRRLVVSTDAADERGQFDGTMDYVFTLARQEASEALSISRDYAGARIVHTGGNLFVLPADGSEGLQLYTAGHRLDPSDEANLSRIETAPGENSGLFLAVGRPVTALEGYGLARERVVGRGITEAYVRTSAAYVQEPTRCNLSRSIVLPDLPANQAYIRAAKTQNANCTN